MLTELLSRPYAPQCPKLFPDESERQVWGALSCSERWLRAGSEVLHSQNARPELPLSLWLDFSRTGNRSHYEAPYFVRRRTLCALTMAELISGTGSLLPAVADACWTICEESAWQVPAHNLYVRDAPPLPLPDRKRPIVDLFGAETGALIATVYGLLGEKLDAYAPGLCARLKQEVEQRILQPYCTEHFWWMGGKGEQCNNWTPWCTQNVLVAAAQLVPAAELPTYIEKAAASLDCFLDEYGEDGCCSEGAQYYRHAALTMYGALELLCAMAPGVFDTVWQEPKIRAMAEYIVKMHVDGKYYLNFSDCSPLAGERGVREYLFGKRVGSTPLMTLAAKDWSEAVKNADPDRLHHPDISEGINLYYHLQTALYEDEVLTYAQTAQPQAAQSVWYPSVGILVSRSGAWVAGVKAGCNNDSHNHNDVGSVTLYRDGRPLLVDIGVETYSKKTFSSQRYEIWTMQSSWHNLPEFDPNGKRWQQLPGSQYRAAEVQVGCDLHTISMNIAPAYGPVPGLTYYRRTAQLTENSLQVQDVTDYPGEIALTLMSEEKPEVNGAAVRFGTLAQMTVKGAGRITTEELPIHDDRLQLAWQNSLYRTRIWFKKQIALCICGSDDRRYGADVSVSSNSCNAGIR